MAIRAVLGEGLTAAEIHHVHSETCDSELSDQRLHHLRKVGVRIVEIGARRDGAVSECRIVGCDHPVLVGEHRNEISEHAGRCRKPVEQQDDRRCCWTGPAIEDLQPTHIDGTIACLNRLPGAGTAANPGGVAPLADAERAAARTPDPSPTKARREAIGIVVLIVMVISC